MRKISKNLENEIVRLSENGDSCRNIAKKLNVCHRTVSLVRKRRNLIVATSKGGRPRLLSDGDARLVERNLATKSFRTPKEAAKILNKSVSDRTVRRSLQRIGLVSAVKKKKPALSEKNVKARIEFCKSHKNWTIDDWKRVIWSDETKVNRFQSDGIQYCWKRPNETIQRNHVKQTVKHGGGNIMVWGCFTWWASAPLVKIDGIMNKEYYLSILQNNLPDFIDKCAYPETEVIFQQDGDPKHTAKIVKKWISEQKFQMMKWPAQSPDLNPIENLWSIVKRRLSQYERAPTSLGELWLRISEEWANIPPQTLQNLVESMPKRIKDVLKNKGLWTKY